MAVEPLAEGVLAGRESLSRGAWKEARRAFGAALAREEAPEALEGLGLAAWWVGDYERATQWCGRMIEFTQRWGMRPLFDICRAQYASVLLERGSWNEAERTLLEATGALAQTRPAMASGGIVRLAELRRRQGAKEEAAALFAQAEGHPLALLGRAELALEADDRAAAEDLARSFLRRIGPEEPPR